MSDMGYGVYVRIQNMDGALWSSNREEWAQTRTDLEVAFGEDFTKALVDSLRKVFVKQGVSNVVSLPVQQPVTVQHPAGEVEIEVSEAASMQLAEEMLSELATTADGAAEPQFEPCEKCGSPKTEWRPPGVSKTSGKKYPGFFGCPNFRNHPR